MGNSDHCIALVEQAALILGIVQFRDTIKGRYLLWFEGNSAVLSGLMKGTSGHAMLDAGAATIHLLLASLEARAWFEYVESDSNWSDGASRSLADDPWAEANQFDVKVGHVPTWPWLAQGSHRASSTSSSHSRSQEQRWQKQELRWDEKDPGSGPALNAHFAT